MEGRRGYRVDKGERRRVVKLTPHQSSYDNTKYH
jgi:hypothetical protein